MKTDPKSTTTFCRLPNSFNSFVELEATPNPRYAWSPPPAKNPNTFASRTLDNVYYTKLGSKGRWYRLDLATSDRFSRKGRSL